MQHMANFSSVNVMCIVCFMENTNPLTLGVAYVLTLALFFVYLRHNSKYSILHGADVLIAILGVSILVLAFQISLSQKRAHANISNVEMFAQSTTSRPNVPDTFLALGTSTYGEAQSIVDGKWNETFASIGPVDYVNNLVLYYSVFSAACRVALDKSPYTWSNLSPNFIKSMPEGCKLDDSKVVFSDKPFASYKASTMIESVYSNGIPMSAGNVGLRGNGSKGMYMGINSDGVKPQSFCLNFLVRFKENPGVQQDCALFRSWANNSVNNGIRLSFDADADNGTNTYGVTLRMGVVNKTQNLTKFYVDTNSFYLITISYSQVPPLNKYAAVVEVYEIMQTGVVTPVTVLDNQVEIGELIDFTNKPIEFGDVSNNLNPYNLMAFGIYNNNLLSDGKLELARYYANILKKTSPTALRVYMTGLSHLACPFKDALQCEACSDMDWSNTLSILTASAECKKAFAEACRNDPTLPICGGCFSGDSQATPECKLLRSILNNTSTCTTSDFEAYKKQNKLCPCPAMDENEMGVSNINHAIIDFYKAESSQVTASGVKSVIELSFWQWFMRLFKKKLNEDP